MGHGIVERNQKYWRYKKASIPGTQVYCARIAVGPPARAKVLLAEAGQVGIHWNYIVLLRSRYNSIRHHPSPGGKWLDILSRIAMIGGLI